MVHPTHAYVEHVNMAINDVAPSDITENNCAARRPADTPYVYT